MLLHQFAEPIIRPVHPHLERGHRGTCDLRYLFVRQLFHVLQNQDFALLGCQLPDRPLQCAGAFPSFYRTVGAVRRGNRTAYRAKRSRWRSTSTAYCSTSPASTARTISPSVAASFESTLTFRPGI